MYYYAVLNENNFVVELVSSETEIIDNSYISITEEQYTSGDLLWLYYKQGQFIVCDNFIGSCDWIIYKNTDRPITPKFDEIDAQIAGKANLNHSHNTATQSSDGYISSLDKAKLDGIETNANLYVHPDTHAASMITGLSAVSTSGSYNDLTDKPTIPTIPTALPADGGNADTLDGYHAAYFAPGQHNHDGVYADVNHTHDYAAPSHSHSTATTTAAGFMSAEDKTKLNGIASGANSYTHPSTHPASMITETDSLKIMTAAERTKLSGIAENANNYIHPETHSAAIIEETSLKKVMTAEERTKLAGIESGANKYSHPSTHPATMITGLSDVATSGSYDDLSDKPTSMTPTAHTHAQSEITGLETALSGKSNTNHTHTAASTSVAGFMSAADKTKLNGIATNANAYTHPSTHAASMITGLADVATSGSYNDLSNKPTIPAAYTHPSTHPASMITGLSDVATSGSYSDLSDTPTSMTPKAHTHSQSDITGLATALNGKASTGHTHSAASTTANGFMSKEDKTKLNGIATGANKTTVDSALSSTSTNPVQNKVINTALAGKASTSHNHNSAYIAKSLQMTADDGDVAVSWTNQDVVAKIKALPTGMHTAYAKSGTTNNPKSVEAWRFMVHKTGATYGWVMAFGSFGSVYTGYVDNGNWQGWKCIYDDNPQPLWKGAMYMSSPDSTPQTVTPSKKLSECRNGWLLLWSDYDKDTKKANDSDFVTTMIPKHNPTGGNWGGKAFYCDIPRYIGSNVNDVDTERRIIKSIYIHDNCIKGSFNNDKDERNDVVLRAVYEY